MKDLPEDVQIRIASLPGLAQVGAVHLTREEHARAAAFRNEGRRACFVLGRATLRELLGERLGVEPHRVPLSVASDGALDVGVPGLHASLSHTVVGLGEAPSENPRADVEIVAVAAVAERLVGVDVEAFKQRREDLYRRILDPSEHQLLDALGEPMQRSQIILWSLKEAALKANRTGLRQGMRGVGLRAGGQEGRFLCRLPAGMDLEVRYEAGQRFVAAVAYGNPPSRARVR